MKACLIFYNSIKTLKLCLDSLKELPVIAIDGAYKDYPHKRPYSTDGSLDLIKQCPNIILVENKLVWENEAQKRTEYLNRLKNKEWFLYIDSDEVLLNLNIMNLRDGTGLVKLLLEDNDFVCAKRLIKFEPGMRYETHYAISKGGKIVVNQSFISESFNKSYKKPLAVIKHLSKQKTKEEIEFKEIQRKQEKKIEKQFRKEGLWL